MIELLPLVASMSLAAPSLHVLSSSVSAEFQRALVAERPSLVIERSDDADVWAELELEATTLELLLSDRDPLRVRLARSIPLSGDREAALRVAVLLTLSALDRPTLTVASSSVAEDPPPRTRESVPEASDAMMRSFHVLGGASFWPAQAAPLLSLSAAFLARISWFRAGLQVATYGVFCCQRMNDVIEADLTELSLGGLIGVSAFESSNLRLSFDLGAGLVASFGSAAPAESVFAGPGLPVSIEQLGLELSAAGEVELQLWERTALVARGGLRVTPGRGSIELPPPFQGLGPPLVPPLASPFLHLGIRFFFF